MTRSETDKSILRVARGANRGPPDVRTPSALTSILSRGGRPEPWWQMAVWERAEDSRMAGFPDARAYA